MTSYPIDAILPELKAAVSGNPSVVLHAPPGAGKTTRVPLALLEALKADQGKIVMLEPRRIAAVSAARWMARTLGEEPGGTVGYTIRFDSRVSARTRIEVVTEGVLTRRIQADPALTNTGLVIFDEFHERSLHADLALALCLDVRRGLRPDLKVLVMSATMDPGPIAALLGSARIIASGGKSFPVQERHIEARPGPLPPRMTAAVRTALRETSGDILVFLPGSGEIRSCSRELSEAMDLREERIALHALYGDLPFEEQERAILPDRTMRKIVLATNIAETSLTIEGVSVVIDGGLTRMLRYDPATGMNRLVTVPVSRASAEQRKGRAGRLGPGVCYRLYSKHSLQSMVPYTQPEILVSDLAPLALELTAWGVKDPRQLSWLDLPPPAAWDAALRLLRDLGALDASGSVTPLGRSMARLPLHPRLSRLMLKAKELDRVLLGADLAALLTERDIFRHSAAERVIEDPDVSERIEALRVWRRRRTAGGGADQSALRAVERTATQLSHLMQDGNANEEAGADTVARLLLAAYPDRVCRKREEGGGRFVHMQGRGVRLSKDSHLGGSAYLIAVSVDAGEKTEGFVHLAAPVDEAVLRTEQAERIETVRSVKWDRQENRIVAAREERYGELVLSTRTFTPSGDEAAPILCEIIKSTPGMLALSTAAQQLQARVALLRRAFPEEAWPDLSAKTIFSRPEEWLPPWLGGIRTGHQLQALDLLQPLRSLLNREHSRMLEERTPAAITVPSGSRIAIDYAAGEQPVLAVKLQELFGLADTPTIAGGRVKLLLHLLSPARRPVQITQDLRAFWNTSYPLVKKEMKGRYPKHPWPDDPWSAAPTRRAKPRGK